jgi:hypothetical protein
MTQTTDFHSFRHGQFDITVLLDVVRAKSVLAAAKLSSTR